MKKLLIIAASAALAGSAFAQKIVIKGSDTLGAKLVPQLAEAFKAENSAVTFEIAAEGSTTGIAAITDGTADIGMSSRRARTTEMSTAINKGVRMRPTIVCWDAMAVIVNESSPIEKLTVRQVEQIFTGDVRDWSAVGGPSGRISVYTRNTSSGTYQDWKDLAMAKRDYAPGSQKLAGNEQIAAEVGKNPNGIGYVGLAYTKAEGVKVVPIVNKKGDTVMPGAAGVHDKSYPYARPNFLYTNGDPEGMALQFMQFILSPAGQEIVARSGFVPIKEASR
jgi:phosphate transport system substrate-binding protein